jgi:heme A synthase
MSFAYAADAQKAPLGIAGWINVEAIRLLSHHTSAVVVAVLLFWLVGWLIRRMLEDSIMKRAVLLLDEVVLLCIFAYFAYELLFLLYLRTRGLGPR